MVFLFVVLATLSSSHLVSAEESGSGGGALIPLAVIFLLITMVVLVSISDLFTIAYRRLVSQVSDYRAEKGPEDDAVSCSSAERGEKIEGLCAKNEDELGGVYEEARPSNRSTVAEACHNDAYESVEMNDYNYVGPKQDQYENLRGPRQNQYENLDNSGQNQYEKPEGHKPDHYKSLNGAEDKPAMSDDAANNTLQAQNGNQNVGKEMKGALDLPTDDSDQHAQREVTRGRRIVLPPLNNPRTELDKPAIFADTEEQQALDENLKDLLAD
ncbi:uncharacterized protein LOC116616323 [Nematostella vectensis]|uniref:uncharacterized protein LOC116616323 n=1 Tax=Nematostella vectensis TaxID=45351 RepID=UPI0020778E82|nr:uncharacterized protein LOC116616323 [Nematostella vectensis]